MGQLGGHIKHYVYKPPEIITTDPRRKKMAIKSKTDFKNLIRGNSKKPENRKTTEAAPINKYITHTQDPPVTQLEKVEPSYFNYTEEAPKER
jgi:hypothetical protein